MFTSKSLSARPFATLRVLPIAAVMSLSLGAGCKKKDKKEAPPKKEAVESKKAPSAAPAPREAVAEDGSAWLEVVGMMPDGANNVVGINLASIRRGPFWKDIQEEMQKSEDAKKFLAAMKRCGVSESDIERVAIGGGTQGLASGVIALSGKGIGSKTKIKCLLGEVQAVAEAKMAAKKKKKRRKKSKANKQKEVYFSAVKVGGHDAFELDGDKLGFSPQPGSPSGKLFFIPVDDNRLALVPAGQEKGMARRLGPNAGPISRTLAGFKSKVGSSGDVMLLGLPERSIQHALQSQGIQGLQSYRAGVDLSKGVAVKISLSMAQAEQAKQAASLITSKVNEQKPMLGFLSLPPTLLDSLKVTASGKEVLATLKLSSKEVGAVRSALQRQAAGQAGAQ